ncbi:MAG: hypothetical protein J6Q34_08660 [Bacteroidales bacterium]|nr:hypothetical protein [Bacteroidales bacterium]
MRRKLKYILLALAVAISTSCHKDEFINWKKIPEGYMPVSLYFSAPDMIERLTKAADPDGKGVNKMNLFCFDNYGVFITHVDNVTISQGAASSNGFSVSGSINEVLVPENTRRIHFIANQNTTSFAEENFIGQTEHDVIAKLEGSSGMVIYWGYFAAYGPDIPDAKSFINRLKETHGSPDKPIRLLRNQARFWVPSKDGLFDVQGFTVTNTCAFGTVAPYHPQKGFNFTTNVTSSNGTETWVGDCDWTTTDFITLPHNTTRLSPPEDVDIAEETVVFETDNKSSDPVSIIIKGRNNGDKEDLYYRVILMDKDGDYVKIRRNFTYTINITGKLYYGQKTFEEALTAPASNNVWLSISDEINEITDNTYSLKVNETSLEILATPQTDGNGNTTWVLSKPYHNASYDLNAPGGSIANYTIDLGYYLSRIDGRATTSADKPVIEWADGCEISSQPPINDFMSLESGDYNEATVVLDNLDALNDKQTITGTVVIRKGLLQRKIKITILKALDFIPVWVSTQVNSDAGENLTLLFTVPPECPDELLPFDVYISAANVDVRHIAGRELPVITYQSNPDEYGKDIYATQEDKDNNKPIGYKYVYTVTAKGDQRIYFKNLVSRQNNTNLIEWVTIESPLFNSVQKTIVFNNSAEYRITMPGLKISETTGIYDENVKYILVPQKKNAPVDLGLVFTHLRTTGNNKNEEVVKTGTNDEFFFYSEFLSHKHGHGATDLCNCTFIDFHQELWGSGGRIHAFRFNDPNQMNYPETGGNKTGYLIHMITDRAKSKEVVRISSNQPGSEQAFADGTQGTYGNENSVDKGKGYRSLIFELENYLPFHFAAQLGTGGASNSLAGTIIEGQQEEVIDNVELDYGPAGNIDVYFDITSFSAADNASVDPFGTKFYVYIVAPMLDAAGTDKLIKLKDGVYAYKVGATREAERDSCINNFNNVNYSGGNALIADANAGNTDAQRNERKKVSLQKKNAVTKGEILITTDPVLAGVSDKEGHNEQIAVFYDKRFRLSNRPITGTIKISHDNGVTLENMEPGAFVSFALERNNSRIGSMTVHAPDAAHNNNSWYELTLRPEYSFRWNDDPLTITHTHKEGNLTKTFIFNKLSLAEFVENPDIVLVEEE